MHLDNEFSQKIEILCDLNHKISTIVTEDSFETEELLLLVDTREQILQNLLNLIERDAELARSSQWQSAIQETKAVVELLQAKTNEVGLSLQKFRHGQRSVQQYKKFL
ncbi:putative flagellar rod protein FlaI [Vibrio sinaloensis DSM 21326]|uniref:Flagellar protein FliT n=1 Tax=Vibrio sinaloensis DSM 21326 TaxID=945550 RepID=E8M3S4_PHOS4|nr:flagellar protein FliT [Vibrio sinaloensis]EGA71363.1 putative flagellar rod protein FlaI [Vibrio sinaloensis DSM 21326]